MATIWSLDTIEFNNGPDVNDVEWWANVPQGWHSIASTGRVVDRITADGSIITGARLSHRSLLISKAQVFAPSRAVRYAAQNALEALVETLVTTPATLTVEEPAGDVSLSVRYVSGFTGPKVRSDSWFEFDLPLVAPNPVKL